MSGFERCKKSVGGVFDSSQERGRQAPLQRRDVQRGAGAVRVVHVRCVAPFSRAGVLRWIRLRRERCRGQRCLCVWIEQAPLNAAIESELRRVRGSHNTAGLQTARLHTQAGGGARRARARVRRCGACVCACAYVRSPLAPSRSHMGGCR